MGYAAPIGNEQQAGVDDLSAMMTDEDLLLEYRLTNSRDLCAELVSRYERELFAYLYRFMGDAAAYNYLAMKEALEDAGLTEEEISNPRTGLIVGSGGASTENTVLAADLLRSKGAKKVGPFMVPRTMGSTTSACLGTAFKIKGTSYSISSACSTSAHCIGNSAELIQMGKQDIIFAGGGEEEHWTMSVLFDGMGAIDRKSTRLNSSHTDISRMPSSA